MITNFDFDEFNETLHMLEWLHPDPIEAIKSHLQENFNNQLEGSKLLGVKVMDKPQWLTGAIPQKQDESKAILVRLALAFSFQLSVKAPDNQIHNLGGVYSWVSVNMNKPEEKLQKTWVDLNGTLEEFGESGALAQRVYFESEDKS